MENLEYNFEDSSSTEDDESISESESDEKMDVEDDSEGCSDCDDDDIMEDSDIDFVLPKNNANPNLITAKIISTELYDGLFYIELDNGKVVILPGKQDVKENGTLTYEEGTGSVFNGPKFKNQPPHTFIACPKIFYN